MRISDLFVSLETNMHLQPSTSTIKFALNYIAKLKLWITYNYGSHLIFAVDGGDWLQLYHYKGIWCTTIFNKFKSNIDTKQFVIHGSRGYNFFEFLNQVDRKTTSDYFVNGSSDVNIAIIPLSAFI